MSASTQRACVLQDVVLVTGGGINEDEQGWIIKPTIVDGQKFGDIYRGDYSCKRFVAKNFKMVEHIKNTRNKKVHELMLAMSSEDDPNEEHARTDGTVSMPERELIDRLPKIRTIDVTTTSMVASVDVVPSWRTKGVLQIEITQPNLDLLLEEPPAEPALWRPEIEQQDVYWI